MLKKITVSTVLNNNYNSVKFTDTEVITTFKAKFFTFKKLINKIPLIELKSMCIRYAKDNNFNINLKKNDNLKEWFRLFEIELNKSKGV